MEWDFNGDGVFDTAPTLAKTLTRDFGAPGDYRIKARLTDSLGASSISAPLVLRVVPLPGDFDFDGVVDAADYVVWRDKVGFSLAPDDYNIWRANFGRTAGAGAQQLAAVPEPSGVCLLAIAVIAVGRFRDPASSRRAPRRCSC